MKLCYLQIYGKYRIEVGGAREMEPDLTFGLTDYDDSSTVPRSYFPYISSINVSWKIVEEVQSGKEGSVT